VRTVSFVKTSRAARYLDQISSHFGHRAEAERDETVESCASKKES
jgi:hypothetical protein